MDFDPDRVLGNPFTVGGIGSMVALRFAPGVKWIDRFLNVICGMALAGYLAPAATDWLQLKSGAVANAVAFVIGLLGMSLCAAIVQGIRDLKVGEILGGWLSRR